MSRHAEQHIQELSVFVHGILAGLHTLGVAYNLKRRNWWQAVAHVSAAVFDAHAVYSHCRTLDRLRDAEMRESLRRHR